MTYTKQSHSPSFIDESNSVGLKFSDAGAEKKDEPETEDNLELLISVCENLFTLNKKMNRLDHFLKKISM